MQHSLLRVVVNWAKKLLYILKSFNVFFERSLDFSDRRLKFQILMRFAASKRRFGKFKPYQSLQYLDLVGQRDTEKRIQSYPVEILSDKLQVLDIGCNMGCMLLTLSNDTRFKKCFFTGIDIDGEMIEISNSIKKFNKNRNLTFENIGLNEYIQANPTKKFDFIFALAVDFWIGDQISKFFTNLKTLASPNAHVLIESNNLGFIQMKERWNELFTLIQKDMNFLKSGTLEDDVTREWVLFTLK
jgi:2-polyprenyl-3-methyl-5-hydroxy-6-metoxy-1,4-benzoquinol methylase